MSADLVVGQSPCVWAWTIRL